MLNLPKLAFLLYTVMASEFESDALRDELVVTSRCSCPGFNVTYECVVKGTDAGFTVWRGSALDCASNEIILRHSRYSSVEGAMGECNKGSIVGRSLRLESGSFYVSQISVRVSSEVIGESIDCVLDDANVTFRLIGSAIINVTAGPFFPPSEVNIALTELGSRQLTFSWSPVAPDCPAIHYNILASNCGSCPPTTNHTNITCTDVPIIEQKTCTFALRTVVCGDLAGILSNPISVLLSNSSSMRESIINRSINNDGSDQPASSSSNGLILALVSITILLTICVAVFTTIIIILVKIKIRLQTQLKSHKTTVKYNTAPESLSDSVVSAKVDTRKNIAYEPNPAAIDMYTRKNVAYEINTVATDTCK